MLVVQKVQKISGNKAFWGIQFDKTIKIMYVTIILKILQTYKKFQSQKFA